MYHTTMPTDSLRDFHEISVETLKFGLPELKMKQYELGKVARSALEERGLISVAAEGYKAPGVLVYYSPNQTIENVDMMNAFKNAPQELQIAMGVPWAIDEPAGLKTWRVGLFGIDKMSNIDGTVSTLTDALDSIVRDVDTNIPKAA
jgi:aspartate aminotransferase-like enzyme